MTCSKCSNEVDPRDEWALFEVVGWEKPRKKGGGLNHLYFPKKTGEVMCGECALRRRYTGDQLHLFGA